MALELPGNLKQTLMRSKKPNFSATHSEQPSEQSSTPRTRLEINLEKHRNTIVTNELLPIEFMPAFIGLAVKLASAQEERDAILILDTIIDLLNAKRSLEKEGKDLNNFSKVFDNSIIQRTLLFERIYETITDYFDKSFFNEHLGEKPIDESKQFERIMAYLTSLYPKRPMLLPIILIGEKYKLDKLGSELIAEEKINLAIEDLDVICDEGKMRIRERVKEILSRSNMEHAEEWLLYYLQNHKKQKYALMLHELAQFEQFISGYFSESDPKSNLVPLIICHAVSSKLSHYLQMIKDQEKSCRDTDSHEHHVEKKLRLLDISRKIRWAGSVANGEKEFAKISREEFLSLLKEVESIVNSFKLDGGC